MQGLMRELGKPRPALTLVLLLVVAAVVVAVVWIARTQSDHNGTAKTTLREIEALQDDAARR